MTPEHGQQRSNHEVHDGPQTRSISLPEVGTLAAKLHPTREPDAAKLLWLPAMGIPAGYYDPFGQALASGGLHTMVLDLRGQGESTPRNGRNSRHGYLDLAERDVEAALDLLDTCSSGPLLVGGHSLGGHIALLHAARHHARLGGLVFVAAQTPHFREYKGYHYWRMLFGTQFVYAVARLCGYWPGHRFGFGGRQSLPLIRDWARLARTGRWAPAGADRDYTETFRQIPLPTIVISVDGDQDAPQSAVDALCELLPNQQITRWHCSVTNADNGGHIKWARRYHQPIADRVLRWVGEAVAPDIAVQTDRA